VREREWVSQIASCASITTRGSLPRNQKTAGVSHLPSFDD
jgi:hypothetical protein